MGKHNTDKEFEKLLAAFTAGEAGVSDCDALSDFCTSSPERGRQIADELEFSELIRQALVFHDFDSFQNDVEYRMSNELSDDLDVLEAKLHDGSAIRPDLNAIARHLADDDDRAGKLRRALMFGDLFEQAATPSRHEAPFLESLSTRMWAQTNGDHFVADIESKLRLVELPEGVESDDKIVEFDAAPAAASKSRRPRKKTNGLLPAAIMGMGVAACVAVGVLLVQSGVLDGPNLVAEVTRSSSDAVWSEDEGPLSGGGIASGQIYTLESGVSSMKFKNGTELTVEGPAQVEVVDGREAILHSGIAFAKTGSFEGGFSLHSKGINLVDSGNSIGIDARSDHATEAMIFNQGTGVDVCLPGIGRCRELYQYEAIRADLDREKLLDIPYNPRVFTRTWELVAGVEKNAGSVRLELPGSFVERDRNTNLEAVQIYVENDSFRAKEDMQVDTLPTGQFAKANESDTGEALHSEGELRSYLVQLWPSQVRENTELVEATITFDHPVVGVIYSSDRLEQSDSIVGTHVGTHNHAGRGMDVGDDEILLSDDRRTMNVKLKNSGADELDHIRVLVALN